MGLVRGADLRPLSRAVRACLTVVALAAAACTLRQAPTAPPDPGGAPTQASNAPKQFEAFVVASGSGPTQANAYAAAVRNLERNLTGTIGWSEVLGLTVHDPARDPIETSSDAKGIVVRVGLSQSRASALLAQCELSRPQTHAPEAWTAAIDALVLARTAAMVCTRRDELFGVGCEAPDTQEANAEFDVLGEGVAVTPIFPDGVPVDPSGAPLRSAGVFVFWHGNPVTGVPLRVTAIDGQQLPMLVTDHRGRAELPMESAETWKGGVRFDLDFEHMVGPLNVSWPNKGLDVRPRPTSLARWALVVEATTSDAPSLGAALQAQLQPTLGPPQFLERDDVSAIASSDGTTRAPRLRHLADSNRGAIDVVLFTTVETRFANRAGGGRVWYEAAGVVAVHDVWSGAVISTVTETVTANGVGHDRAEAEARTLVAKALAAGIGKALGSNRSTQAQASRR